jgi:hypothetical protein
MLCSKPVISFSESVSGGCDNYVATDSVLIVCESVNNYQPRNPSEVGRVMERVARRVCPYRRLRHKAALGIEQKLGDKAGVWKNFCSYCPAIR